MEYFSLQEKHSDDVIPQITCSMWYSLGKVPSKGQPERASSQVIPRYLAVAGMYFRASGVLLGKLVGLDRCAHVPPYLRTPSACRAPTSLETFRGSNSDSFFFPTSGGTPAKLPSRPKPDRQDGPNVSDFAPHDTNESDIAARCIDAAWEATAIAAVSVVAMDDHSTCTSTALRTGDSLLLFHDRHTTQRQCT